jgi:hypothetical protein
MLRKLAEKFAEDLKVTFGCSADCRSRDEGERFVRNDASRTALSALNQ